MNQGSALYWCVRPPMDNTYLPAYTVLIGFFKYIQTFGTVSCMQKPAGHQASRYQEKVLGSLGCEGCSLLYIVKSALHVPDYCNFNVDSQYYMNTLLQVPTNPRTVPSTASSSVHVFHEFWEVCKNKHTSLDVCRFLPVC